MSKLTEIEREMRAVGTMVELTSVFEGIASMKIARIKNQVLQATEFFNDLWGIYTQLRVDSLFRFGRGQEEKDVMDKQLLIINYCAFILGNVLDNRIGIDILIFLRQFKIFFKGNSFLG